MIDPHLWGNIINCLIVNPIVLSSGEVSYEYDGPVITSLSTADGDTFGTVKCEILGHNFGASANLGSVYVNGAKIPAAQISEYGHNRIVLLYLGGVTGVLYVELGAKVSDEMSFEIRSPRSDRILGGR